ncbi:response regulator transcription factor [Brevibacillus laterosporus]|uniref:DNA-binding response regulator n=2 Tax=Brevibacillus laterosporus TaxID=1465 RepID=A0AAP3GAK9_BRELA|nr:MULTISPECIES: response regulator transcription factor [Brevibacillus]ATO49308.1 DNA-binding response regulator [Brevibacillus laterosporus DSM 25]MBG9776039.1 XRE family transcriptional regulator [Brevibacillus laterosporus]MBG9796765.1 XRE family transcriptional regulator [Brevibacillus laterosporus]MBG9800811.1 XRE family transcriptional regulator [Brevibacillus laterosporus]MCG7315882.1 response regulator transcription factor [Brevibacillus laterosporus]
MKVLVVDDENSLQNLMRLTLEIEGYQVLVAANGEEALAQWEQRPDMIILDVMLPDIDGYQLLREFREKDSDIPIIMLTAKGQINDKLLGLQLGADDYITKPFHSTELLLRIKIIERRLEKMKEKPDHDNVKIDRFLIHPNERKVFLDGNEITLTYREYDLLFLLLKNRQRVFTRDDLLMKVWKFEYPDNTRAVDIMIQRLRKKLGAYGDKIKTVYGVGYKIDC